MVKSPIDVNESARMILKQIESHAKEPTILKEASIVFAGIMIERLELISKANPDASVPVMIYEASRSISDTIKKTLMSIEDDANTGKYKNVH